MQTECFFHFLLSCYDDKGLRLEIRRQDLEAHPQTGRRHWKSAWYPLDDRALTAAYKTALVWQNLGDVYMGALPRWGESRLDRDITQIGCLWVEIDGGRSGQRSALEFALDARESGSIPPPHLMVGSGGGVHCYWLLCEPWFTEGKDLSFALLLKRLCFQMGNLYWQQGHHLLKADDEVAYADPVSTNLGRLLRVPGTFNHKPSRRCPVVLLASDTRAPRWSIDDWDKFLPAAPRLRESVNHGSIIKPGQLPKHTRQMLEDSYAPGERYPALRSILCSARHCGWSEEGLHLLASRFAVDNPGPPRCDANVLDNLVSDTIRRVPIG